MGARSTSHHVFAVVQDLQSNTANNMKRTNGLNERDKENGRTNDHAPKFGNEKDAGGA